MKTISVAALGAFIYAGILAVFHVVALPAFLVFAPLLAVIALSLALLIFIFLIGIGVAIAVGVQNRKIKADIPTTPFTRRK